MLFTSLELEGHMTGAAVTIGCGIHRAAERLSASELLQMDAPTTSNHGPQEQLSGLLSSGSDENVPSGVNRGILPYWRESRPAPSSTYIPESSVRIRTACRAMTLHFVSSVC